MTNRATVGVTAFGRKKVDCFGIRPSNDNNRDKIARYNITSSPRGKVTKEEIETIDALTSVFERNSGKSEVLISAIKELVDDFNFAALPEKPQRDYRPRESIISYLKADGGFGPWLERGLLTRPLLRDMSPKAYTALANWLRNNTLESEGLSIPTRSEVVLKEGQDLLSSADGRERIRRAAREAQRLARRARVLQK